MTENAVTFIMFLRELYKSITPEKALGADLSKPETCRKFFEALYATERTEIICAAFLNNEGYLIACERIGCGHPTASAFDVRTLTKLAFDLGSNRIVLAHNHPNASAEASGADYQTTRRLLSVMETNSIRLVDHIIVGNDGSVSMAELEKLEELVRF